MTPTEHLADLRERFGPSATRVGDPPTAGDVALLLRMLDAERAAVVAWLRSEARKLDAAIETCYPTPNAYAAMQTERASLINAADAIERGEHRKGRDA